MILENNNAGSICKDNIKVRNTWSVSGDALTVTTDGDRLGTTTNTMLGGYDISASAIALGSHQFFLSFHRAAADAIFITLEFCLTDIPKAVNF